MQFRFALRVTVLCILLSSAAPAVAALQLIYPEPASLVVSSRHLILKLGDGEITGVVVSINGVSSDLLPVGTPEYKRAFRDFLILQPLWDEGANLLAVDTFNGDNKLESLRTVIFYAPPASGAVAPAEFKRTTLHRPEAEALCRPCHNMKPTEKQVVDLDDKDNACYACHKRMGREKFVHTPVSMYACVSCHSLKASPKYSLVKQEPQLCFDCHKEMQKEMKGFKFLHGPVAAGMCEICHDHHSSENTAQLHKPINSLCLSCHEKVAKGIHVVPLTDGSSHPISGKVDPSDRGKGRELSCVSCHDPHGGAARYYYVTGNDNRMELCQDCHKK